MQSIGFSSDVPREHILSITGPGGWPRTMGHDLKFESTERENDAGLSFSASRRDATR